MISTVIIFLAFASIVFAVKDNEFDKVQVCTTLNMSSTATTNKISSLDSKVYDVMTSLGKLEKKIDIILNHLGCILPQVLKTCDQLPSSCSSGYYVVTNNAGALQRIYCNMDKVCGGTTGGWRRIGFLNMANSSVQCPSGFKLRSEKGIRACVKRSSAQCVSIMLPSLGISYSKVCGRVTGYQIGSTDATRPSSRSIDGTYLDGVSLTRGSRPRKHIWSFYAAIQEISTSVSRNQLCPCSSRNPISTESFVGKDYFCESGSPGKHNYKTFYTDPLWDGKQCGGIEKKCCQAAGIPWFTKSLDKPTDDYIELRVCTNGGVANEDVAVGLYEVYTK